MFNFFLLKSQKPILLQGHTRALTKVKYNSTGDLIFSCSKDQKPSMWKSINGERLGTFDGHSGALWDLDISVDSQRLLTASADSTMRMWDVFTGKELFRWEAKTAVRSVAFAEGDKRVLFITDATMGNESTIHFITLVDDVTQQTPKIDLQIVMPDSNKSKATIARWGPLNEYVIVGHEDGTLSKWNAETGEMIDSAHHHTAQIQDIQFSKDKAYFITASKDTNSLIVESDTFAVLKTFSTDRPVNAAAISPIRNHIMLGGGQEAMSVTTTAVRQGKFEVRFFHKIFSDEIGRVKGHFGPINTLAFHPDGRSFSSGGEDGYVRVHYFDDDYFKFFYDEEL